MKKRLDQILVDRKLAETKTKAQALIMAGQVFVGGSLSDKSGRPTAVDAEITVKEAFPYVSRGALKLEKAYQAFGLDFTGKTICDIGSSTGGFTDFALQHGAVKSFAIDVGTGQLAQKIREDERVVVMERTDFRDVIFCPSLSSLVALRTVSEKPHRLRVESANSGISSLGSSDLSNEALTKLEGDPHFPTSLKLCRTSRKDDKNSITDPIDIFVCDVSFISLKKIIPKIASFTSSQTKQNNYKSVDLGTPLANVARDSRLRGNDVGGVDIILLIKPQFEAGAKEVSKGKGVIKDEALRHEIVEDIKAFALESGFTLAGLVESPITGAKGNVEYLLYLTNV